MTLCLVKTCPNGASRQQCAGGLCVAHAFMFLLGQKHCRTWDKANWIAVQEKNDWEGSWVRP